jgi:hypothetical protein
LVSFGKFYQDGASTYWYGFARTFLDQQFSGRWIGCGGPTPWLARSPDITPFNFFLWRHLKSVIYANKPVDIPEFKQMITDENHAITLDMVKNAKYQFFTAPSLGDSN